MYFIFREFEWLACESTHGQEFLQVLEPKVQAKDDEFALKNSFMEVSIFGFPNWICKELTNETIVEKECFWQ